MIGSLSGRTAEPHADYRPLPAYVRHNGRSKIWIPAHALSAITTYLKVHVYQHHRRRPQFASRT